MKPAVAKESYIANSVALAQLTSSSTKSLLHLLPIHPTASKPYHRSIDATVVIPAASIKLFPAERSFLSKWNVEYKIPCAAARLHQCIFIATSPIRSCERFYRHRRWNYFSSAFANRRLLLAGIMFE